MPNQQNREVATGGVYVDPLTGKKVLNNPEEGTECNEMRYTRKRARRVAAFEVTNNNNECRTPAQTLCGIKKATEDNS